MSKTYLISLDTLKTIGHGALGALTFGAYNQYLTTKTMELNNEKMAIQNKYDMEKIQQEHEKNMENIQKRYESDINELKGQINLLQTKSRWW